MHIEERVTGQYQVNPKDIDKVHPLLLIAWRSRWFIYVFIALLLSVPIWIISTPFKAIIATVWIYIVNLIIWKKSASKIYDNQLFDRIKPLMLKKGTPVRIYYPDRVEKHGVVNNIYKYGRLTGRYIVYSKMYEVSFLDDFGNNRYEFFDSTEIVLLK